MAPRLPASVAAGVGRIERPVGALPDPAAVAARLNAGSFAGECIRIADEILAHRFPILGFTLETGRKIQWRRDYASGVETGAVYFRRIPYLDIARAGDHKTIWELNRHQHLALLAQAWLFSGRKEYLAEIVSQLESWLEQNPFSRGMNWTSALEVAFRALSWIWVYHLAGDRFEGSFRRRFLDGLYQHGLHLEVNLSYYFSPNTHLLGEAVALHALGTLFPQFPSAANWRETGAGVVRQELERQVPPDGCHFERSTYYHVYALDMFLFHAILRGRDALLKDDFLREKLVRMAEFLDAILGIPETLPFFGDDDGGRFFHPYGARNRFGLATLATSGVFLDRPEWIRDPRYLDEQAAWWLDAPGAATRSSSRPFRSKHFADCGLFVMTSGDVQLIADAGSFGPGSAGHSHADTLSMVLRRAGEEILIDPGTYTYVSDPAWRERFRGTAAHNTIRIDGLDQAIPRSPFAWQSRPEVEVIGWESRETWDRLTAACAYAGFRHQRQIVFRKDEFWIAVIDRVEGPPGEHRMEQFWHLGAGAQQRSAKSFQVGSQTVISLEAGSKPELSEGGDYGWISPALGAKQPAPVLRVERRAGLPLTLATVIDLSGKARTLEQIELPQ